MTGPATSMAAIIVKVIGYIYISGIKIFEFQFILD